MCVVAFDGAEVEIAFQPLNEGIVEGVHAVDVQHAIVTQMTGGGGQTTTSVGAVQIEITVCWQRIVVVPQPSSAGPSALCVHCYLGPRTCSP